MNIIIKKGLILDIPSSLKKLKISQAFSKTHAKTFAIITDSKVRRLYGGKLLWNLRKVGFNAEIFSFTEGEKSKNLSTVGNLEEQMAEKGFDRSSCIIALGGGVVGDIAGLLASTFMRGIPYIQVPTTLLAMIDSSIGGKTGVNLEHGKNLFGTFYQPKSIFIDPYLLKTLPQKQLKNGLAEAIKYGVIKDTKLFKFIEKNSKKILNLSLKSNLKIAENLVRQCVKIKVEIVKKDEKETSLRQILNYGHTFGHAIEKMSNYTLLHGFAISIGMVLANQKAVELKIFKKSDADRIKNLLKKAGLPVYTMHKPTLKDIVSDKKKHGETLNFILPKKIGEVIIYKEKIS